MIFFENVHKNIKKKMIIMCVKTGNIWIFVRFLGCLYFQFVLSFLECAEDDFVHVVVAIFCQSSAEDDGCVGCQLAVLFGDACVAVVVDGVEGFHAFAIFGGVFARDDGLGVLVDGCAERFEVLVLDDAGVGHVGLGVVDDCVALVVGCVECLGLEAHGAVVESSEAVVEELVDGSGEDDAPGLLLPVVAVGEEVGAGPDVDAAEQLVGESVVAADGDALVGVVEVVVVVDHPDGQSFDDEGGQLGAGSSPLLFGVALDEPFVDVAADEGEGLLFEVAGFADACAVHGVEGFAPLLVYLGLCLVGCAGAPHLVKGVHVEGQVVEAVAVAGHGRVGVAVELDKAVHVLPHASVGGVEDVCAVAVHVDARHFLAANVSAGVFATVDDETAAACLAGLVGKDAAEESCADNEIIVRSFHRNGFIYVCKGNANRVQ